MVDHSVAVAFGTMILSGLVLSLPIALICAWLDVRRIRKEREARLFFRPGFRPRRK